MGNKKKGKLEPSLGRLTELAEDHWPEDKWSFLYAYSRKALDEEIDRFQRIDDKSVKLLSSVSIIITIFVASFKWIVEDSNIIFSSYIYFIAVLVFGALCFSWFFFFRALKLTLAPRMPVDDSIFELFKTKNMATIHVALYKSCKNALDLSRSVIEDKATKLKHGYTATSIAGILLIIFVCMLSYEKIMASTPQTCKNEQKETHFMSDKEDQTSQKQSSNEPDLDITAPEIQLVTNGADLKPNKQTGEIILNEKED